MAERDAFGPLAGMKVFELAHIMSGPACGMMPADIGPNVIKMEKPEGDGSRRFLPPARAIDDRRKQNQSERAGGDQPSSHA